jgi:tRNA pseudouridine38-40 synthase
MKIRLTVEYDGTSYCGWQIQPNGPTIQGELEEAARRLFGRSLRMAAAGRTDSGVHALGQVVCFDLDRDSVDAEEVRRALDALTPEDIVVREAAVVSDGFDPRRSARRRTYLYQIWNRPTPQVFLRRYAWHLRQPLDVGAMDAAAALLVGERDFSTFQAADCDADNPVRRIDRSTVRARDGLVTYEVAATAFLRHMVRAIVGTLVEVGGGRRSIEEFAALVESRQRSLAGQTAPAKGLILVSVEYGEA